MLLQKKSATALLWFSQCFGSLSATSQHETITKRQASVGAGYTGYEVPSYNISIPVDHFNASDTRTYNNRYWVNDTYYQAGGPVFFYDHGEEGVSEQVAAQDLAQINKTSAAMVLAEKYNGVTVFWEHRYYGLSFPVPFNATTHEPESGLEGYKYHTVEQALEDVVYFANNWQPEGCNGDECSKYSPQKVPWVWIGGSYPGMRGVMMRIRNPEIFYATWASSAPIDSRSDGSAYYAPITASLPSNCSKDIHAAVVYADEIMSGTYGNETFQDLQRLVSVASTTQTGLNNSYNLNSANRLNTYSIGALMASAITAEYQVEGPSNTTDIFCSYLESYNPNGTASNTTDKYITILSNSGDGEITDQGIAATYNNTVALEAYFYAARRWWELWFELNAPLLLTMQLAPDFQADQLSWRYQVLTELGWVQGSDVNNITIISEYFNVTGNRELLAASFSYGVNITDFPAQPNSTVVNQYGGWNMTPSNIMFTDGEHDPWRPFTVMSEQAWIGAPIRNVTQEVPACGQPPQGSDVFGLVYPGSHHVPDLTQWQWEAYDDTSPVYQGVQLFSKALDAWLPCFNASSS